jgi:rhodanese-related sulfurtransferase
MTTFISTAPERLAARVLVVSISAPDLRATLLDGDEVALIDIREGDAYADGHISVASPVPDSELELRIGALVPRASTRLVLADDDGGDVAASAARRLAGLGYREVRVLEGGVTGWAAAGYELITGLNSLSKALGVLNGGGPTRSVAAAARIAARFGVRTVQADDLLRFRAEASTRTLYVFDVRGPEEYAEGHLPGSRSVPGGRLVQATDQFVGTRGGRVVLVDRPDRVRATIAASWLIQLGLGEVYVYGAADHQLSQRGDGETALAIDLTDAPTISPYGLACELAAGDQVTVIDLQGPPADVEQRRHVPGSLVSRRSTLLGDPDLLSDRGRIVLTSADGVVARLAAQELSARIGTPVVAIAGGTEAWLAAGFPYEVGLSQQPLTKGDALRQPPGLDERQATFERYVAWGEQITDQLARDGLVRFRLFDEP